MPPNLILYDQCRPSYPPEALEAAEQLCGVRRGAVVADIGCGSGIFAERLLAAGYTVVGVEPLEEMRELAAKRLGRHGAYSGVCGSAENTTLEAGSIDLVTAASALHWFTPSRARTEFRRILRTPKWVVALWNFRVSDASAFSRAFEQFWREHLGPPPAGNRFKIESDVVPGFFDGDDPSRRSFDNPLLCTEAQLLGLVFSSSNAPLAGDTRGLELEAAVRELHREHNDGGTVTVPYQTVLYCGQLT
jgi:SAM-dependent methyltransferase